MPPAELAVLAVGAVVLGRLFGWAASLERRGRAGLVVIAIFGLLLFESALWSSQGDVPAGIFHPSFGGFGFRLYEILIPLALLARLAARGAPKRIGATSLWWAAFATWYGAAAIVGLLAGHDTKEILFEAKAIAYVVGGYALAAGVPVEQFVGRDGVLRLTVPTALAATVLIFTDRARWTYSGGLPGVRLQSFGDVGADTASLFVVVALLTVGLLACRERRPLRLLLACGPLLVSAVFAEQRAALLGLVISAAILIVAWLAPTARRRLQATPTEMGLVGLAVVALVLVPVLFRTAVDQQTPTLPLAYEIEGTFSGPGNEQSAQQRVNQYRATVETVRERPILGWGLGKTITYYATGQNEYRDSPIAHNIGADLLIRSGAVGLVLFLLPVTLTVVGGFRVWRYHPDDLVAGFALVCCALVLGLIGKGMVESIFEKYRLAVALGLLLGMLRSTTISLAQLNQRAAETREARVWN